jgi:hypothetical protein
MNVCFKDQHDQSSASTLRRLAAVELWLNERLLTPDRRPKADGPLSTSIHRWPV